MTDNTQELNEILSKLSGESFDAAVNNPDDYMQVLIEAEKKAKQATLDWHNKQVEEVLIGFAKEADTEYYRSEIDEWLFSLGLIVHKAIIEAERNKLR